MLAKVNGQDLLYMRIRETLDVSQPVIRGCKIETKEAKIVSLEDLLLTMTEENGIHIKRSSFHSKERIISSR